MLHRLVPALGVLTTALFVGAVVWAGATYPGYDHLRQFISETGATGAVTAPVMNLVFKVASALSVLFWLLSIFALPRTPLTIIGCVLSALSGVGLYLAGVYSCDFGCTRDDQSTAAALHDLYAALSYVAIIVGMAVLGFAARRWPGEGWFVPLGLICAVAGLIGFVGIVLDVEFAGLSQRVTETGLWSVMLAVSAVVWRRRNLAG